MKNSLKQIACAAVIAAGVLPIGTFADVSLPVVIAEGMVLQQKAPIHLWGWADTNEKITVKLGKQTASTIAKNGSWSVDLKALPAGGPYAMSIEGKNKIEFKDVLVGEVWFCSGQSNMEFLTAYSYGGDTAAKYSSDSLLRLFTIEKSAQCSPQQAVKVQPWQNAGPVSTKGFSAVGYYFGRSLRANLKVPVGLIHASWGGTRAEAWTSKEALEKWGVDEWELKNCKDANDTTVLHQKKKIYEQRFAEWKAQGAFEGFFEDTGTATLARTWSDPATSVTDWKEIRIPSSFQTLGPDMEFIGGIWFRRTVEIPAAWAGKELSVSLGVIDDYDSTYFNGVKIGFIGKEVPNFWTTPRSYKVPASAVKAGSAVIAVRLWDHYAGGGMLGPTEDLHIKLAVQAGDTKSISLVGNWLCKPETKKMMKPVPPQTIDANQAASLYNGMVNPVVPYGIKGAIWYQGEANVDRAKKYTTLLPALINDWRVRFQNPTLSFLIVQLANYMNGAAKPKASVWAELREAQATVSQTLPNTGLACAIDIGDSSDIHPKNKLDVGERLAKAARAITYGQKIEYSGPVYAGMKIDSNKVRVSFTHVDKKGLVVKGDTVVHGFALAGADKKFVYADAVVDAKTNTVLVSSSAIAAPVAVRYAWGDNPKCNLFNADSLPAVPFRSDKP